MNQDDDGNFTLREFRAWAGIGNTKTFAEIAAGRLRAIKIGGRTIITKPDARAWRATFPAIKPHGIAEATNRRPQAT
jgi:hypothetical protein